MPRCQRLSKLSLLAAVSCLSCILSGIASDLAQAADAPVGKLVVIKALYGDLPDGPKTDVTDKVAAMVKEDKLSVEASNDNFGDPIEGTVKKLKVEYTVDGVAHSKTVNEGETLSITGKPSKIVILKALYGDLPDGAKTDVTAKVADRVDGDSLSVGATNDNFGDPAEGIVKKLKVDYTFEGKEHSKTVNENEMLIISDKPSKIVILKAVYGDLPDGAKTDVMEKVADKLNGDTLSVDATNDNFGDPAEGIVKKLTVDYKFDGKEHSKTVNENETLTISDKGE